MSDGMSDSVREHIAVVAGASGLVGEEVVRMALAEASYSQVVALVRRPLEIRDSKLKQVITDYEPTQLEGELAPLLAGAHVFCCLGTTIRKAGTQIRFREVDYAYPLLLGELASRYGASAYLLVSAMGASAASRVFYSRVKGELERDLSALQLPELHIFRPSLLLGKRQEFRLGERIGAIASRVLRPLLLGGLRPYRAIEGRKVAAAMVQAALHAEAQGTSVVRIYPSDQIEALIGTP